MIFAFLPAMVLGAALLPSGEGRPGAAAHLVAPFLAGLGLFPVVFTMSGRRAFLLAGIIVAATIAGEVLGSIVSGAGADLATVTAWVLITFACLGGLITPLVALGYRGTAASVWLIGGALLCGSVFLVPGVGGEVPQAALNYNPIVRILKHGLGYDWLHAANLYPRIGTLYYSYPERSDGIMIALAAGAAGAAVGSAIAFSRRRRVVSQ
jgi:hypothetical protein